VFCLCRRWLPTDNPMAAQIIENEFKAIMKIDTFNPSLFKLIWHEKAIPQYGIESGERFEAIAKAESEFKGLQIGGNLRNGIGMADRILQGTNLAKESLKAV